MRSLADVRRSAADRSQALRSAHEPYRSPLLELEQKKTSDLCVQLDFNLSTNRLGLTESDRYLIDYMLSV